MRPRTARWLGLILIAVFVWHGCNMTLAYSSAIMLWSSHVATMVLALGLIFGLRAAVAAGFLFHVAIAFWAWLVETIFTREIFWGSVALHILPIVFGAAYLRGTGPLGRGIVPLAWAIQVVMMPITRWTTKPDWNVNLAHAPWTPVAAWFPQFWLFHLVAFTLTLGVLVIAWWAVNRLWLGRTPGKAEA